MTLAELIFNLPIDESFVRFCLREEWLHPESDFEFDLEDRARLQLIWQLRSLGINDESMTVVLHLLDQVHALRHELQKV